MKNIFLIMSLIAATLTIGTISYATEIVDMGGATGVGDGGTGVICVSPNGYQSYELLDLYEANKLYGVPLAFTISQGTVQEEIVQLQSAFETFTGETSLDETFFFASLAWVTYRDRLSESFDVMPLTIPLDPNCKLSQFGYRYIGALNPIIEIDRVAWQNLDSRRQALLLIHEALHPRFPAGFEGASALRQVVAYMAAPLDFQMKNAALIRRVLNTGRAAGYHEFRN